MEGATVINLIVGILLILIANNNRQIGNNIKELKEYVMRLEDIIFKDLEKKQNINQCINFHKAHDKEHVLENKNIEDKLNQHKSDIDNIAKIARGNK